VTYERLERAACRAVREHAQSMRLEVRLDHTASMESLINAHIRSACALQARAALGCTHQQGGVARVATRGAGKARTASVLDVSESGISTAKVCWNLCQYQGCA